MMHATIGVQHKVPNVVTHTHTKQKAKQIGSLQQHKNI